LRAFFYAPGVDLKNINYVGRNVILGKHASKARVSVTSSEDDNAAAVGVGKTAGWEYETCSYILIVDEIQLKKAIPPPQLQHNARENTHEAHPGRILGVLRGEY
jgi:hypothetical protein